MENAIKMDDNWGGSPISGNLHISTSYGDVYHLMYLGVISRWAMENGAFETDFRDDHVGAFHNHGGYPQSSCI